MKKNIIFIFLIFLIFFTFGETPKIPSFPKGTLKLIQGSKSLEIPIEIADREELWSFGLMFRKDIPWNFGMLFIFPEEERVSFWMKNTFVPLDIAFIDSKGIIFNIQRMTPCKNNNCPIYFSPKPCKYALEVKAGFFKRFGFKEGARIEYKFNN